MEAVECGAAALGIILGYYGRYVPLEELRVACGVSRDGSKAGNMLKAARAYGLIGKGLKREPPGVFALRLPVIVFWNFNHFVVVEGRGPDRVYLNDPANGPRTVSSAEFDAGFTGVVLALEPGPDFQRGGQVSRRLRAALRRRLRGSGAALAYILCASLALVLLGLVVPAFIRIFVDDYLIARLRGWLPPLLLGMALTALLMAAFAWLQQRTLLRLETKLALTTSGTFFWHVLRLPIEFFTQRYAGEISARVGLNDRVAGLLAGELATNLLGLVLIVFYVALMLRYDGVLTALALISAGLNLAALRYVARRRSDGNRRLLQERGKLVGTAYNGLQLIETLKAGGAESDFFARWAGQQAKVLNTEQELRLSTQVLAAVPPLLLAVSSSAVLVVGGWRVIEGQLTIGTLMAFQVLLFAFLWPVGQLVNLGSRLQEATGDLARLDDVLRYPVDPQTMPREDRPGGMGAKLSGRVEIQGLTFGYNRLDPPLIDGFSLRLRPGARVALVGGSGSGKSTLAKLVAGLYEPWAGTIRFDGQPRAALPRALITNSLALVDQEITLFAGTVKENLTLWEPTVPEAALLQAAKDAQIHEDIAARPGGYEHLVEENGRNFSGGQRQRLEIARALAGNPTILVLDEATSALDPVTEQQIDDHLRRRGCTCLIIAHRLSTIRDCDEILVLDQGRVVERGTHDQLMRRAGVYTRLMRAADTGTVRALLEDLSS
jgi:NHLM bacteriocin system ABC transporter peptidase/ATP-binding protein